MMISDGVPLGYREATYSSPDFYPAPAQDVLRFLTGEPRLDSVRAQVTQGQISLPDLFEKATAKNLTWFSRFDELAEEEFKLLRYARPPGYSAQTILHMGRLAVMALLDYGATCSGMPEEVAIGIISHALKCVEKGKYSKEDDAYPIVKIHKYEVAPTVDGIAAGSPLEIRYGLVIRCEFVSVGKDKGPFKNLYFKIFPRETCNIPGCIVGFPVLDAMPNGLGHSVHHTVHAFEALGVSLPRLELGRKSDYTVALAKYLESDGSKCFGLVDRQCALSQGECGALRISALREDILVGKLSAVAVADCAVSLLQPGEEALIPAVWDRAVPDEDFVCETTRCTELDVGLDTAPGVCPGGERQLMLSVRNDSHESVMVQRGLPLAVAVETIAELASSVSPDGLTGEEIAKRAVKTGDFTTEAVLEVLRKMKIPLNDSRDNVLPVGVEKIRSMLLGL